MSSINPTEDTKTQTIILADDNPENLNVLSRILENEGYKVRTAKNGQLALNSILAAPPDIALIDIHMPVMDGYELCKQIKENPKISDIPVLFISAMGESFNKVIAFELGAVDYLSKPVDEKEVLARVNAHLKIRQLQKSLQSQNEQLEQKVEERTQELQKALDELEVLHNRLTCINAAKNEYLKLISHELRTPLIGLGIVDELIHAKELTPEESKSYQDIFWSSHQKLINIVDHATMLTQLQLKVPHYKMNDCNLHDLIVQSSRPLQPLIDTQGVYITVQDDDGQIIQCDKNYITIVFNALLETAIKFCRQENSVEVNWSESEGSVHLKIVSTGWILPEKYADSFFDVFAIQEPIFPGGDLGLAPPVAKQIINVCGGEVKIKNRGDEGITLEVIFPPTQLCS